MSINLIKKSYYSKRAQRVEIIRPGPIHSIGPSSSPICFTNSWATLLTATERAQFSATTGNPVAAKKVGNVIQSDDRKQHSPVESPSSTSTSPLVNWRDRVLLPTLLAGIAGGGYGLVSKHRKVHGAANVSATHATNFAIVTGCYCGAHEFVRVSRKSDPDDLINSALGGFGCGALLGRLEGGQAGAIKYSVMFAVAGTAFDYTVMKLRPILATGDWFKLPEWSPIKVLDEEELAAKQAREVKLFARSALGKLNKEES